MMVILVMMCCFFKVISQSDIVCILYGGVLYISLALSLAGCSEVVLLPAAPGPGLLSCQPCQSTRVFRHFNAVFILSVIFWLLNYSMNGRLCFSLVQLWHESEQPMNEPRK